MRPETPTCVGCGAVGSPINPLLTALPQEPTLTFKVCTRCFHAALDRKKEDPCG